MKDKTKKFIQVETAFFKKYQYYPILKLDGGMNRQKK
jgi:hypothetical protein